MINPYVLQKKHENSAGDYLDHKGIFENLLMVQSRKLNSSPVAVWDPVQVFTLLAVAGASAMTMASENRAIVN